MTVVVTFPFQWLPHGWKPGGMRPGSPRAQGPAAPSEWVTLARAPGLTLLSSFHGYPGLGLPGTQHKAVETEHEGKAAGVAPLILAVTDHGADGPAAQHSVPLDPQGNAGAASAYMVDQRASLCLPPAITAGLVNPAGSQQRSGTRRQRAAWPRTQAPGGSAKVTDCA